MSDSTRDVPEQVSRAAAETWKKWSGEIAAVAPRLSTADFAAHGADANSEVWKTPEERMIDKIRRRMDEFPEWYETDQNRLASTVCAELERIGATLAHALPRTHGAVDVWQIPLSVFNWLVDGANGVRFIRGALSAWSDAQDFNAANAASLAPRERASRRAAFLDIAPPLLKAVLEQLLDHDLAISFGQKYAGPEFKALIMRAQRAG